MNGHTDDDQRASVEHVFDQFVHACTCKAILSSFQQLLDLTGLRHAEHSQFYGLLKDKLKGSWKAQALWTKIDKRAAHKDYKRGTACKDIKVLVIGAGPCGLRTAIECALLGAKTVLVEKRDRFSRNNVLHLWPYLITDLRNLGAKKFFGKFCSGAIDHISIRQLQCILMKVALLLGVEVHVNVSFDGLLEPPEDQSTGIGWRCRVTPPDHALSEYIFDVLIGADGKRNTLPGFTRKEFRGKLAIAITANFINRNSSAESRVEEISGVAFIFNQKFFLDLRAQTRIDLENIVYYKDDTHYFVMTVKKASLLEKGVLKEDYNDTISLLDRANINQEALLALAKEAANFSTHYQMPHLEYAVNHYGTPDVAMFDFTSMFAAENASRFLLKNGHHLLMGLVGDSLLEPFWPTGSGCARGFLGAFDAAWMIRSWAMGKSPQQVLAERESVFTVLSQTTPQYLHKNFNQYSIDPNSRYPNLNVRCVKPFQVRHLYEGGKHEEEEEEEEVAVVPSKRARNGEEKEGHSTGGVAGDRSNGLTGNSLGGSRAQKDGLSSGLTGQKVDGMSDQDVDTDPTFGGLLDQDADDHGSQVDYLSCEKVCQPGCLVVDDSGWDGQSYEGSCPSCWEHGAKCAEKMCFGCEKRGDFYDGDVNESQGEGHEESLECCQKIEGHEKACNCNGCQLFHLQFYRNRNSHLGHKKGASDLESESSGSVYSIDQELSYARDMTSEDDGSETEKFVDPFKDCDPSQACSVPLGAEGRFESDEFTLFAQVVFSLVRFSMYLLFLLYLGYNVNNAENNVD